MTDTGKCTDKAIASCKKQGKLCNVETARCVSADPKRKVKGAVYDKKRSLYFPQGLLFEDEDGSQELVSPKKKSPPKKRLAKKKVSPKKKTPSPKKKSPPKKKKATPKKKSANEELLCFEEEAEPCEDGEVCSATGKCVPKTTAFLRKKKKIPLHGKEVYGTELQFKNLSKKYADVSKARKYEVEEEIRIEAPKQASPAIKKTAKKIEEVVEEADLSEEVKQVIVEGIEAALAEGHKEEKREEKGKEKEEEEPKKKSGSGRKKKKVSLPESESRQVEKSAEEIQQEFERCLGIQVSGL